MIVPECIVLKLKYPLILRQLSNAQVDLSRLECVYMWNALTGLFDKSTHFYSQPCLLILSCVLRRRRY